MLLGLGLFGSQLWGSGGVGFRILGFRLFGQSFFLGLGCSIRVSFRIWACEFQRSRGPSAELPKAGSMLQGPRSLLKKNQKFGYWGSKPLILNSKPTALNLKLQNSDFRISVFFSRTRPRSSRTHRRWRRPRISSGIEVPSVLGKIRGSFKGIL